MGVLVASAIFDRSPSDTETCWSIPVGMAWLRLPSNPFCPYETKATASSD
jgi:hypothetical protein